MVKDCCRTLYYIPGRHLRAKKVTADGGDQPHQPLLGWGITKKWLSIDTSHKLRWPAMASMDTGHN